MLTQLPVLLLLTVAAGGLLPVQFAINARLAKTATRRRSGRR